MDILVFVLRTASLFVLLQYFWTCRSRRTVTVYIASYRTKLTVHLRENIGRVTLLCDCGICREWWTFWNRWTAACDVTAHCTGQTIDLFVLVDGLTQSLTEWRTSWHGRTATGRGTLNGALLLPNHLVGNLVYTQIPVLWILLNDGTFGMFWTQTYQFIPYSTKQVIDVVIYISEMTILGNYFWKFG